jgi:hypothetical protein
MKANEFSKPGLFRTKYALGISLAPETEAELAAELTEAMSTIQNWRTDRGKASSMVLFTLVIPPDLEKPARNAIASPGSVSPSLRGITDGLKIEINVLLAPTVSQSEVESGPG